MMKTFFFSSFLLKCCSPYFYFDASCRISLSTRRLTTLHTTYECFFSISFCEKKLNDYLSTQKNSIAYYHGCSQCTNTNDTYRYTHTLISHISHLLEKSSRTKSLSPTISAATRRTERFTHTHTHSHTHFTTQTSRKYQRDLEDVCTCVFFSFACVLHVLVCSHSMRSIKCDMCERILTSELAPHRTFFDNVRQRNFFFTANLKLGNKI